jgi:hypothetical protein
MKIEINEIREFEIILRRKMKEEIDNEKLREEIIKFGLDCFMLGYTLAKNLTVEVEV